MTRFPKHIICGTRHVCVEAPDDTGRAEVRVTCWSARVTIATEAATTARLIRALKELLRCQRRIEREWSSRARKRAKVGRKGTR